MENKIFVLKVGGSLLSKSDNQLFDFSYAYRLKNFLKAESQKGYRFVINVGGGFLTRKYLELLKAGGEADIEDLHCVGVAITNLHAEIVHGLFDKLAYKHVIRYLEYEQLLNHTISVPDFAGYAVVIASASQPGASNDLNAAQLTSVFGCKRAISMKNVAGVFTSDPKTNPNATLLPKLTWQEYLDVIGNPVTHVPGANYPIDPLAAKFSTDHGLGYIVVHGENLENLQAVLEERKFVGTEIHD
jgi:uridylate kinase